jgi:hypothetical protein
VTDLTFYDVEDLAVTCVEFTVVGDDQDEIEGYHVIVTDSDGDTVSILGEPSEIVDFANRLMEAVQNPEKT